MNDRDDVERAYENQAAQETERWVSETLRNVSLIAAGFAMQPETHAMHVANAAWMTYQKLEQLVRNAAP